jgi:electron transport complex protein RnfB
MGDDPYDHLADALDRLPNGFPRTDAGLETRILAKICRPEEAALAALLTGSPETVATIAARAGRQASEIGRELSALAERGLVWPDRQEGDVRYRLAPFVVGLYEARVDAMDTELARLMEEYLANGGARGIMGPRPALHRVVPAVGIAPAESILPYDDVRALLLEGRSFAVNGCICRLQQEQLGERCPYPTRVCLSFSRGERAPRPGDLTQAEALALLDMTEQVGLVHTVSNVAEGVGYVCNCCSCCCGMLRGLTEWAIPGAVASASYYAVIEPDLCADCGTCIDRCQVGAISQGLGSSVVDQGRCIGCGLCATGCPNDVARLVRRPEAEVVRPPRDVAEWERLRSLDRGLPVASPAPS